MRILIVDDSEMVSRVLVAMLRKLGHEAVTASTAADALAAADYGLVLLDHSLPDRPGSAVAKELRARGCTVPIYGISGHDDAAARFRGSGVDGHVRKPFQLGDLAALVGTAKARAQLGSADLAEVMLRGVLEEVPRLLQQAAATDDPGEMRRLAHTIGGALRFLDDTPARAAAARLERSAKEDAIDESARAELVREWAALKPRLVELLR